MRAWICKLYEIMKRRKTAVSEDRTNTVIHGNVHHGNVHGNVHHGDVYHGDVHIASDPPDLGDVNEIKSMTQAEYDALPTKKEKTLYLIVNRSND